MAIAYLVPVSITFLLVVSAFLKDTETPKTRLSPWLFIITVALIWPITLPFIINSKLKQMQIRSQLRDVQATSSDALT